MGRPPAFRRMGVVVAGYDDGRDVHFGECRLLDPHDGPMRAFLEQRLEPRHGVDEVLRVHVHQLVAVGRVGLDALAVLIGGADARHAAFLGGADELAIVILGQASGGERPAGDAQQQQAARRLRVAQPEQDRDPGARRRAADERRQRVVLGEQFVEVVGPHHLLDLSPVDQHVGRAGVAAVVEEDPEALGGDLAGQRDQLLVAAPAAGDQRHRRPRRADDLVVDVQPANIRRRHVLLPRSSPSCAA